MTRVADLRALFPNVEVPTLVAAIAHYERVFPGVPLAAWRRNGTFMERWTNGVRIAFAPRQKYASIYFQTADAPELYRIMGGECPSARVTITLPYGQAIDDERLRVVIARTISG